MKENDVLIERRSQRAERFRKVADSCRRYRIGFFSVLGMLVASEMELDLSNQIGEKVKFHLNPDHTVVNQSKDCK